MMWWNGDMGWWPSWISGFMMLGFWVLIIVGIILLVRSLAGGAPRGDTHLQPPPPQQAAQQGSPPPYPGPAPSPQGPPPPGPAPGLSAGQALAILQERYARGEIDREEFLQKKADLEI